MSIIIYLIIKYEKSYDYNYFMIFLNFYINIIIVHIKFISNLIELINSNIYFMGCVTSK